MSAGGIPQLGIVTGLASEAACLRVFDASIRPRVRCAGVGPDAARLAATALLETGCNALLSFGCAGGLDPRLGPGDIVISREVVEVDGRLWESDQRWIARLLARLHGNNPGVVPGRLLGSDRSLGLAAEKQRLGLQFDALAVDMESHAVADVAAAGGVPMLAVRAICDTADTSLPGWLDGVIDGTGRPKVMRVVGELATHPGDIARMLRLARAQRTAVSALRSVALGVGPLFAFD